VKRSMTQPVTLHALISALSPYTAALIDRVIDPDGLGDHLQVTGARSLARAATSEIGFCKSPSPALLEGLGLSAARIIVTTDEVYTALPEALRSSRAFVLTGRPRVVVSTLTASLVAPPQWALAAEVRDTSAFIDPSAKLDPGVVIGRDVRIGARSIIGPNTVLANVTIGQDTVIGPNCSIGGEGFGFETDPESGMVFKVPHFGHVVIGSRVEIFSNVCIARGSFDDTVVEDDVKIDNLVHIAHNCRIQRGAFVIANAMIAGSVTLGEGSWIAPSTSVLNGTTVGRYAMTGLGAVVVKSVDENTVVAGVPAKPLRSRYPSPQDLS
jgi:UDP-3-O-[3-hydroxymyristoyl] glucosamine N-acyltransferase